METSNNEMLITFMCEFLALMPTQLPDLLNRKTMDPEEVYDDYAQLTYHLDRRLTVDQVSDMFEDNANLRLLYHRIANDSLSGWQVCCAFTYPNSHRMYKFNVEADDSGIVHTVTVYIFHSLENMRGALRNELAVQHAKGGMQYEMTDDELINMFF